jgi:hypothetical protein
MVRMFAGYLTALNQLLRLRNTHMNDWMIVDSDLEMSTEENRIKLNVAALWRDSN